MNLLVKKLDLMWDGDLPRDSMAGDRHRELFCHAQPLLHYAFKVEKPAFIRVWWFDRLIVRVLDTKKTGGGTQPEKFYTLDCLLSDTDRAIGEYLVELGWQVRVTTKSINRLAYATLAIFSPEGAILQEDEAYSLKSLFEAAPMPEQVPIWIPGEAVPDYAVIQV